MLPVLGRLLGRAPHDGRPLRAPHDGRPPHASRTTVADRDFDEALGGAGLLNHGDLPGDGMARDGTEPLASRRRPDGLRALLGFA